MTEDKEQKKTATLRPYDKREAQRKSIKEKEAEEAAEHYTIISPQIIYDGNEVNSMKIWLEFADRNGAIYIGRIGDSMRGNTLFPGKLRLNYVIGRDIDAKSFWDSNGDIIADWTVHTMEKILVRHNKLNTGIIIEKIFGIFPGKDDKVKQSIYIPMSRISHIIADGELRIPTDEIEK